MASESRRLLGGVWSAILDAVDGLPLYDTILQFGKLLTAPDSALTAEELAPFGEQRLQRGCPLEGALCALVSPRVWAEQDTILLYVFAHEGSEGGCR